MKIIISLFPLSNNKIDTGEKKNSIFVHRGNLFNIIKFK